MIMRLLWFFTPSACIFQVKRQTLNIKPEKCAFRRIKSRKSTVTIGFFSLLIL